MALTSGPGPAIAWGSYLGGSGRDEGNAVAVDTQGNFFVTGYTCSADFPAFAGMDRTISGTQDAFVAKFTAAGLLAWATYFGGSGGETGYGVAVDSSGDCYVTGLTGSSDLATPGGLGTSYGGNVNGFVAKLASSGELMWARYIEGDSYTVGARIAIDRLNNCYVTGLTNSSTFPTPWGFNTELSGGLDAFVAKYAPSGRLMWASYLGGGNDDAGKGIACDPAGNCYITGFTCSTDFPVSEQFGAPLNGTVDAFVAKVTSGGSLAWAYYIGGSDTDMGEAIATDTSGNCYAVGVTRSSDFPTVNGPDLTYNGGEYDAFAAKLTSSGQVVWAGYIGGSSGEEGRGVAVDVSGNCYVTGYTQSADFPAFGGLDLTLGGASDAFVAAVTPEGQFKWISYLGGGGNDGGQDIAVNAPGSAYMTGYTRSTDFPTVRDFGTVYGGSDDAFAASIILNATSPVVVTDSLNIGGVGMPYSAELTGSGGTSPFVWSASGDLPAGLSLDWATGAIRGIPIAPGTATFTAEATDLLGNTATKVLSIEVLPAETRWLRIDEFQVGMPATAGHDSFVLKGSFGILPEEAMPPAVTLAVGAWSITLGNQPALWKRRGGNVYSCTKDGVTCRLTCRVGGTNKCLFQFTGSRLALQGSIRNATSIPIGLQVGSDFDRSARATMTAKNHVSKLLSVSPPPFYITRLSVTRNLNARGRDSLTLNAKVYLDGDLDPVNDSAALKVGPYAITLAPGTMPAAKNRVISYMAATPNGRMRFEFNNRTHTLTVSVTGADMSAMTADTFVSLSVGNHTNAQWSYKLVTARNETGTRYKY